MEKLDHDEAIQEIRSWVQTEGASPEGAVRNSEQNGRGRRDVVTIWKYYKKQNDIQEIVTAHPMADLSWYNPDKKHGVTIGLDSVFVASEAMLVPLNPDVVVVNGTTDKMNTIYTFIVDKDAGKAILLPSNCGCVGFTSEEGLPICLSFRHHANGESGRYSVVSVYDEKGNLVKEMSFEDYKKDEK